MEQRSPEWLSARVGRVTGSVAGAILGHAPYATRDDILRRMVRDYHGAESEFQPNIATDYGTINEDGALIDYRMETGNDVELVGFIEKDEWAGCSPDGLIGDDGQVRVDWNRALQLPDETHGHLFVFRVFERVAYALILDAQTAVRPGDRFTQP